MGKVNAETNRKLEKVASDESAPRYDLLPTLSDLEEQMKMLQQMGMEENEAGDTFAQRAEWFYQRRPMLLSLLQDLFTGYTTLLNRSNRTQNHKHDNTIRVQQDEDGSCNSSAESEISCDVESTLSFQQIQGFNQVNTDADRYNGSAKVDEIVLPLVTKSIENDMLLNELLDRERQCQEASGIIELLKKVVELLEMEKEMAAQENTRLGYKVRELLEENRDLAAEALFVKQEAVKLARCVLNMKDEHFHRVCLLQDRIYTLQAMRYNHAAKDCARGMASTCCFGLEKYKAVKQNKKKNEVTRSSKRFKWLKTIKFMNPFIGCDSKKGI